MHTSIRDMVRVLLVAISAVALVDASPPQDRRDTALRNHARNVVDERQLFTLTPVLPDPSSTARTSPPGSEPTAPSSTSTRETTTRSTAPTSPPPTSTTSSAPPPSTTPAPPSSTSKLPPPETSTVIVTATNDDGSPTTLTTQTTSIPTNQPAGGNGGGMPEGTKTTVIGVVVGIGGAIVLVGLGFLAWRIWGRNRNNEDSDELMGYGGAGSGVGSVGYGVEKTSEAGGSSQSRTPFQSTLESYHAPTHVNPSSNF